MGALATSEWNNALRRLVHATGAVILVNNVLINIVVAILIVLVAFLIVLLVFILVFWLEIDPKEVSGSNTDVAATFFGCKVLIPTR